MDGERFDHWTRTWAGASSRRGLMRLLAGVLGGGLLVALGQDRADARPKRTPKSPRCPDPDCPPDMICVHRRCRCANDELTYCGPELGCRDLEDDRDNCGSCGNACRPDQTCHNGRCRCPGGEPPCNGVCCVDDGEGNIGQKCCGGACVNVLNSPDHCGSCGNDCGDRECCFDTCCAAGEHCFREGGFTNWMCCPEDRPKCGSQCGCPEGEECVDAGAFDKICCPIGHGEVCNGVCCPAGEECVDGACQESCPGGVERLSIRGESCCPTGSGNSYFCGRFKCDFALSRGGPGGCDLWCKRPEEGGGCGPDVEGIPVPGDPNQECCCGTTANPGVCVWP